MRSIKDVATRDARRVIDSIRITTAYVPESVIEGMPELLPFLDRIRDVTTEMGELLGDADTAPTDVVRSLEERDVQAATAVRRADTAAHTGRFSHPPRHSQRAVASDAGLS